jgi:hypothetical protein
MNDIQTVLIYTTNKLKCDKDKSDKITSLSVDTPSNPNAYPWACAYHRLGNTALDHIQRPVVYKLHSAGSLAKLEKLVVVHLLKK